MKCTALNRCIKVAFFCIPILYCAGCQSFRWGERSGRDLEEVIKEKEAESRYWMKPDRSLQDPLWTP